MDQLARLIAIEDIRQLKAKYFFAYDHKDWDMWRREVWAPDARLVIGEMGKTLEGIDAMIEWVAAQAADQVSVHHGHTSVITITSDTTATGVWAMEDLIWRSREHPLNGDTSFVHGWGHYLEDYVKLDCGWRLRSTTLTRLRAEYSKVF